MSACRFLLWEAGDPVAAQAAVHEALALIPESPPSAARARAIAHDAGLDMMAGRPRPALTKARHAAEMARSVSGLPEEALALGIEGWAMAALGRVDDGVAAFRQALAIAELIGSIEGQAIGYANLVAMLDRAGRVGEALEAAREAYAITEAHGLVRTFGGVVRGHEARLLFHLGRWSEAGDVIAAGLAARPIESARMFLLIQRVRLGAAQGRADETLAALEEAQAIARSMSGTEHRTALLEARVEAAAWAGNEAEGRAAVDEALRIPIAGQMPDPALAWVVAVGVRIEADAAERGRATRDAAAVELAGSRTTQIVEWARGWLPAGDLDAQVAAARQMDPRAAAIVALLRAEETRLQGRPDPGTWLAAADAWAAVGRPLPETYARFRQAAASAESGDRAAAIGPLRDAFAVADRLGAAPLLASLTQLAHLLRVDPVAPSDAAVATTPAARPGGAEDALGLTPRELEVLRLVAAGWSNPEIGEALGISRKTASVHVSNLLGKLGVENRVEAAVVATRLGLAADAAELDPATPSRSSATTGDAGRVRRAFMFTDIVGSTPLLELIGDAAWRDLLRWHDTTLRSLFAGHGGQEVHHAGDGFFVAFLSPSSAAACAVATQRSLAEHRRVSGFAPAVRIGLHVGEAERDGSDFAGAAVHVAARIAALAEGGQILASRVFVAEARSSVIGGLSEVSLKGVASPVEVAVIAW